LNRDIIAFTKYKFNVYGNKDIRSGKDSAVVGIVGKSKSLDFPTMLIFWSLVRNSVVLAVYLLFSVACFLTVHEHLAKELNSLASKTSVDNPMSINRVGTKIIAIIGNEQYTLYEYPDDISNGNSNVNSREVQKRIIVDVKSSSDIELNLIQTRDVSKYITLNITETQAENNWCVAYSLAAIIRTQTTFTTSARSIAIMALGANPSTQSTIPWDQVSTISKKFGLNPKVLNTTATNSVLTAELNAGRPCIIAMFPKSGNMGHAVVLRGYNSSGIWSIWNPWYSNYESYSMNGSYVPTGYSASELSLTAKMHAYNFK